MVRTQTDTMNGPLDDNFDKEAIVKYVKAMLGSPPMRVELSEPQFDVAISSAFELFSTYCPQLKIAMLNVAGDGKYQLPYIGRGLFDVQSPRTANFIPAASTITMNLGDGVTFRSIPVLRDSFGIDQINEVLYYNEMTQRLLSADFSWEVYDGHIYLKNVPPSVTRLALVYFDNHNYETLPFGDRTWVKDYTLAKCKIMLGRVRGKYNTPGPAGQSLLQDAGNLVQEGTAEEAELKARILKRSFQLPFVWG